jgi:hypothetical protein
MRNKLYVIKTYLGYASNPVRKFIHLFWTNLVILWRTRISKVFRNGKINNNQKMKIESDGFEAQLRYNFTYNFLVGARAMTNLARKIEEQTEVSEEDLFHHKAFVVGAIMQCIAALETEAWSLLYHGPGHYLGSDGHEKESSNRLTKVADSLESKPILEKYNSILCHVRGKNINKGIQPMQDLRLVVKLRNELVHFKSKWTSELDRENLYQQLEQKDPEPPPFFKDQNRNFFPHKCLTSRRAEWATTTAIAFLDYFYDQLGFKSPLDVYGRDRLTL